MPNGKIIIQDRYTRDQIRRLPTTLFVFGDNMLRVGYGGQAAEARGEPNSVGIVTKMSPHSYLHDELHYIVKDPICLAFDRLRRHLRAGHDVVWPKDGVGSGLADLPRQAPLINMAILGCRDLLFKEASEIIGNLSS